jgi:iron complex outermembrane receptor protein
MPVYNIQRIEVLRGPGSAVYGADALAGTINIITKTGGDINGTEVGGRGGSFDSYEGWALHGERGKNYEVAAAFHYGEEVGHNEPILQDHQTALDRVFKTNISHAPNEPQLQRDNLDARLDASLQDESGATWRANASYQGWRDTGSGAGPAEAIDTNGDSDYALSEIVLGWQQPRLTENWDVSAELAYTHHYYFHEGIQVFPPGAQGGRFPIGYNAEAGIRENDTRVNFTGLYKGFQNQVWRMGMGYFYGDQYEVRQKTNWLYPPQNPPVPLGTELVDISDTQFTFQQEEMRQNINAFLQDSWAFAQNWELTAGGRYDWYSDFGDTFNLRGALVWRTSPDLIAKLMYGEAFRAPSFQELYNAYNPLALGNPDLSPETIQTLETAFDYRASENLHLTLNLYAFTWKDAILFQTVPGRDTRVAANASGDRDGRGLELEARWKMTPRSSLLFNYALQRVEEENGQDIGGYPQQDGYARVDWMVYPNWYVDAQANYIGERERQAGDPRPALDGYVTLDLALRYKNIHGGNWNLALGLRNALDEELYEPSPGPDNRGVIRTPYDLPQAGRGWFAEVRYAFR